MDSLLNFFPESKVNSRINNLRNRKSLAHSKKKTNHSVAVGSPVNKRSALMW
jgi:hypothetical protein